MEPQHLDYLRQISRKVDDLLARLSTNGGGSSHDIARGSDPAISTHVAKLASILDPQELLVAIMDSVIALTGAQRGFLMLIEEGNKLRFKVGRNVDQQSLASQDFQLSRTTIKQVIQSGEPVYWDSSMGTGEPTSSMRMMRLQSVLCVPLRLGKRLEGGQDRVGGVVYVDSTGLAQALGEQQMRVLAQLAQQAAVALENAQIFQKSERERAQVSRLKENIAKLYEVGRSISSTLILDDLLVTIVDNVVSIAQAQRGFVMLLEEKEGQRELVFKVGRDARKRALNEEHFAFSTTIARKTIDEKKPQVLTSALGGEGESASLSMVEMKLQSIMCVPLIEKDNVIGLVYVDSQQENKEFGEADAEVLESLAGQAAVAIVNAKLYAEASDKERIKHELELGAKIQSDLLPKAIPPVDGLEIFGFMKPAKEVGGDYYDFIAHEGTKRTVTIAIGDVSGKGVGAGIVMAMARSALRSLVHREKVPTSTLPLVQGLNAHLSGDIPRGMFMTLNVLNWNAETKKLKYTPAGHEHILIYRAEKRDVERLKAGGIACGVMKQANAMMKELELSLGKGDHVLLYTDGVTECMNAKNEEFELDRLIRVLKNRGNLSPKELCDYVYAALEEFRGQAEVHDDITLVALKSTEAPAQEPPITRRK